ncbi:MAG: response regulator [Candidatus Omnitrophica bacterium]|nr:response regulator [Candidatus Omnitrophota bacterium]
MLKPKILLIDNEPDFVELTKVNLQNSGFEVFGAFSGKEGIDKFGQVQPDLVLLDILMPEMDGFEVLHRIRKIYPQAKNTPIIMLTAIRDSDSIFKSLDRKATDYIMKPFVLQDLLGLINKYI